MFLLHVGLVLATSSTVCFYHFSRKTAMDLIVTIAFFLITATTIVWSDIEHDLIDGRRNVEQLNRTGTGCWNRCKVQGLRVDCSLSKCTSVPSEIDRATIELNMNGNNLEIISENSFARLLNLQHLDLSSCGIRLIKPGTFDGLEQLKFLNLSFNPKLPGFPECVFCSLNNLTDLILTRTNLTTFKSSLLTNITGIRKLWLGMNQLLKFPSFIDDKKNTLLPNIRELNLENNNIERIGQEEFSGLETLEALNLIGNRLFYIKENTFKGLKKLWKLELDRNFQLCPHPGALRSESITFLSLSDTYMYASGHYACRSRVTRGIKNLQVLNISRSKTLFNRIYQFYYVHRIKVLILCAVGLRNDMVDQIARSLHILRYLDISENEISVLKGSSLEKLKLEVLIARDNWFSVVDLETIPQSIWSHLKRVDFSENTIYCDCKVVWFRRWLKKNMNSITIENLNLTQCTGPADAKNTPIHLLIEPNDLECFQEEPGAPCMVAIFLTSFFVLLIAPIASILHRLRWILKYWYFRYKTKAKEYRDLLDNKPYEFDAFISYSESDTKWVVGELRPRLENEFGLRLCIHHRDWLVGRDIVDNIVESIESSRKTVLIVSNAFAVSHWCHFEMTMAQTKLFEDDRDNLILVLLEEIADCNMNQRLQLQMQRKTYIEWTDNLIGQQLFWAKLQQAVSKQSISLVNASPPLELFR